MESESNLVQLTWSLSSITFVNPPTLRHLPALLLLLLLLLGRLPLGQGGNALMLLLLEVLLSVLLVRLLLLLGIESASYPESYMRFAVSAFKDG